MCVITYRNSGPAGFPNVRISCACCLCSRIPAKDTCTNRRHGTTAKGHTIVDADIRVIAQHDGIFDVSRISFDRYLFFDFIFNGSIWKHGFNPSRLRCFSYFLFFRSHRAKDYIMFATIQLMIITDDYIIFSVFQIITSTYNSCPFNIGASISKTTYCVVSTCRVFSPF